MTNPVAGGAGQFIRREAGGLGKAGIDVGDVALEVCGASAGSAGSAFLQKIPALGHGQIGTHN